MAYQPSGQPSSYRMVPNRNVTQKWKNANTVDYDGYGYGDEDYEEPPLPSQGPQAQSWSDQPALPSQPGQFYGSDPNAVNHSPVRSAGRPSFDQGPARSSYERRPGKSSFDQDDDHPQSYGNANDYGGPYPRAQGSPFPGAGNDYQDDNSEPQFRGHHGPPPLHLQTNSRPSSRDRAPYSAAAGYFAPHRGVNQHFEPHPASFSAAPTPSGRRSQSSGRPAPGEIFARRESPVRPGSRDTQGSSPARFERPPRKSSLSQQNPPYDGPGTAPLEDTPAHGPSGTQVADGKALPFVRPIDIWNRHKDEMSDRSSQESSRPSFDPASGKFRPGTGDSKDGSAADTALETGVGPKTGARNDPSLSKIPLPPVPERKSEYGTDKMTRQAFPRSPSAHSQVTSRAVREPEPQSAASDYSSKLELNSAASVYSQPSVRSQKPTRHEASPAQSEAPVLNPLPPVRTTSGFGDDFFDRAQVKALHSPSAAAAYPLPTQQSSALPNRDMLNPSPDDAEFPDGSHSGLQRSHRNSYRSLVEQAFDESQREPPTPVSAADTLARSNSASASDISPIVSRTTAPNPENLASRPVEPTIQEEPSTDAEPTSVADVEDDLNKPIPAPVMQGYRRDTTPPSRDNSPARRPLSIATSDVARPEVARLSSATPTGSPNHHAQTNRMAESPYISSEPPSMNLKTESIADRGIQQADKAPAESKSASDEYRDWEAQRKQFNARRGIQDSPSMESPPSVSRTESPGKGTVRDLASKLETRSGRSSPLGPDSSRPFNSRLESFRPVLPGGWQSYATNAPTPMQEEPPIATSAPVRPDFPSRTDTTESQIPRAVAPRRQDDSAFRGAFAAASAAGSALTGAFSSIAPSKLSQPHEDSSDTSEDESNVSHGPTQANDSTTGRLVETVGGILGSQMMQERGQAMREAAGGYEPISRDSDNYAVDQQETAQASEESPTTPRAIPPASPPPPPPLPKDTPREGDGSSASQDYFPAPLRTSRSGEAKTPTRPPIPESYPSEISPRDKVNERLQQEIVKSLTPKSSPFIPSTEAARVPLPGDSGENISDGQSTMQHPSPPRSDANVNQSRPGFLDQRFSWETPMQQDRTQPSISRHATDLMPSISQQGNLDRGSPDTVRAYERQASGISSTSSLPATSNGTPRATAPDTNNASSFAPSTDSQDTPSWTRGSPGAPETPSKNAVTSQAGTALSGSGNASSGTRDSPTAAGVTKEIPLRQILEMERPEDRMKAYAGNREYFTRANSGLEQWLQEMGKQSPASAAILARNGGLSPQQTEAIQNYKPSPSRNMLGRLTSDNFSRSDGGGVGPKQLQKYGAKAGVAAKGFLARRKDKLRTGSAGDKANRRRSSGAIPTIDEIPQHSSSMASSAPQIPAQTLNLSQPDEDSWALPFRDADANSRPLDRDRLGDSGSTQAAAPSMTPQPSSSDNREPTNARRSEASPRVSAFGSPYNADGPSRSISEVTQPEDRLPAARTINDHSERNMDPRRSKDGANVTSLGVEAAAAGGATNMKPNSSPLPTHTSQPSLMDANREGGQRRISPGRPEDTRQQKYALQKEALGLSDNRRLSNVSAISSPSQGPDLSEAANRSISPAPVQQMGTNDSALPSSHMPTKSIEATMDRDLGPGSQPEEALPMYESARAGDPSAAPQQRSPASRIAPGTDIVPVADLTARKREQDKPVQPRPYSFAATNSLEPESQRLLTKQAGLSDMSAKKQNPDGSVSEAQDGSRGAEDGTFRAHARQISTDPDVQDHPAFRSSPIRPGQEQDSQRTESPLPSARRPQEELDRYRQLQENRNADPAVQPMRQEEGFRIPGPYGQEYRSPKTQPQSYAQRQWPNNPQQQQLEQQRPFMESQGSSYQQVPPAAPQQNNLPTQSYQPSPSIGLAPEKPKHRTLGGFFRQQSRSGSREDVNEKRNSIFKSNSRQDSIASRNSQTSFPSESQDQLSALPAADTPGPGKRRPSKDFFRSSSGGSFEEDKKKKRHSGLGSLFSRGPKSAPVQRSSTTQGFGPNGRTGKLGALQQEIYEQQVNPSNRSASAQGYNGNRPSNEQFRGTPPPADGYYAQQTTDQNQWPQDVKRADGQYQQNAPQGYGAYAGPQSRPNGNAGSPQSAHSATTRQALSLQTDHGQQLTRLPRDDPASPSYHNPGQGAFFEQKPNNLRIDTGAGQVQSPNQHQFVPTAPPVVDASSYDASSYDPTQPVRSRGAYVPPRNTSPYGQPPQSSVTHTRAAPPSNPSNVQHHAIDLHRRSRSPKLGRKSSDEDMADGSLKPDPVNQLGTFRNRSPVGGSATGEAQEKPWSIQLPEDEEERERAKRRSKQLLIERGGMSAGSAATQSPASASRSPLRTTHQQQPQPTVAETLMGPQSRMSQEKTPLSPSTANKKMTTTAGRGGGKEFAIAELSGSKPEGYESDEEISMSATAYPGQEWMPPEMGYGKWDD